MRSKSKILLLSIGVTIVTLSYLYLFIWNKHSKNYIYNQGKTQGTYYNVTYFHPKGIDLQAKIEARMLAFDSVFSVYNTYSIISRINRNDTNVQTNADFEYLFTVAQSISAHTQGAFDITVGPLVKAWGFSSDNTHNHHQPNINDLLSMVGYEKIHIKNHRLLKSDSRISINVNAIAQGYSVDLIAKLLENNGCTDYMVEIGGELMCKGKNPTGSDWKIGIANPIDDSTNVSNKLQNTIAVTNKAVSTSGNYRKFYYKNGKKYAHIIDPRTGYPTTNNILSVTVIAPTCIVADAYATAFMVLGVDSALQLCKKNPQLDCYLIYNKDGENKVLYNDGFKKYLSANY